MQPRHDPNRSTAHHTWPTTAIVDWCEDNFTVWFLAELVNTLTNLSTIALGAYGLLLCRKHHYSARFYWSFMAMVAVGAGSALFHGTLTYEAQLLDELPMLFGTSAFLYAAAWPERKRPPSWWMATLAVYPTMVTAVYVAGRQEEVFQIGYTLMAAVTMVVAAWGNLKYIRPANESTHAGLVTVEQGGRTLLTRGIASYVGATCIWVAENMYCHSHLIPAKEAVGYPWRVLLEGHGWWHLGTGYGCALIIASMVVVRHNATWKQQQQQQHKQGAPQPRAELVWHWGGLIPEVVVPLTSAVSLHGMAELKHRDVTGVKAKEE
ncbi:ceramidase-domain-containing protein [Catenaria anguillulae PL171]|uniref:Ceramidase-domain-containing protein n=1 Tax=Catenaria anguillulae PL171 TaxID=765915 RepID=A0A1Y2I4Z4_9FUNG|nr:ceramidase-domain-containing protein [Catenaria anguillulae PL171]